NHLSPGPEFGILRPADEDDSKEQLVIVWRIWGTEGTDEVPEVLVCKRIAPIDPSTFELLHTLKGSRDEKIAAYRSDVGIE
ncbi:hypothetical protein FRB94_004647, partial [Tulasnella sp. JGI-2019a]